MSDLIDLKSPEGKTVCGPKLASPLIPAPLQSSEHNEKELLSLSSPSSSLDFGKRSSLDNNPFDLALHKTVEYVRKQEDPFEVVLEKALTYEQNRTPKSSNIEFKDDFTPKKRKYSDILKLNKTLDDFLVERNLNNDVEKVNFSVPGPVSKDGCDFHSESNKNEKVLNGDTKPSVRIETVNLNCSILNESTMNDSLTESSGSVDDNLLRSIMDVRLHERIRGRAKNPGFLEIPGGVPKLQKHRRSLSQGDKISPRKSRGERCHSIVDSTKEPESKDTSSILFAPSIIFEDNMNKAFLQFSNIRNGSVQSSLSNISSITRLGSVSSAFNSPDESVLSQRTINRAFIESSESEVISTNVKESVQNKMDRISISLNNSLNVNKSPNGENLHEKDFDDLILKYAKLRIKSSDSTIYETLPHTISQQSQEKTDNPKAEEKLIDVDIFIPEKKDNSTTKSSVSSTSSDSVFVESDPIDRSIFSEAKTLAKTFEELASKSNSLSVSSDDLLNSRPNWNFDMLPVSDDEALVDDLIELKKTPEKNGTQESNGSNVSDKSKNSSLNSEKKLEQSMLDDFDPQLRDPEKKVMASTLMLDLEKLVKSEANSEAEKLLKSLRKALGVKCDSNVDLLATCLSQRNDLPKSPQKSKSTDVIENVKHENAERSPDDNRAETSEGSNLQSLPDEKNLQNSLNVDRTPKRDKSPILVSEIYENTTPKRKSTNESMKLLKESPGKLDDSIKLIKEQNQMITDDQKMAVEILVGLGKLLTGDNKDPETATLLKNLGVALNLASSNNSDQHTDSRKSSEEKKRPVTPVKNRIATPPRKTTPLSHSKIVNRRSLELNIKAKTPSERGIRRSFSVTQTSMGVSPNYAEPPRTPLSADKSKAHLKDGRKRFSSDPCPENPPKDDRRSIRGITLKAAVPELPRRDKPVSTMITGNVKNRFRKNNETEVANKRGPMKAILPLGNMQRRGLVKKDSPINGSITPPKLRREPSSACTVATSTPFPSVHLTVQPKKSPKSKPMASSTPDDLGNKHLRRSASQIPQTPVNDNLSCNISPVTSKSGQKKTGASSENSPSSKAGKAGTPPKSRQSSQLPRFSPMFGIKSGASKAHGGQRRSEGTQGSTKAIVGTPKSPGKKIQSNGPMSPLNSSNKLGSAVKPLNLISKLTRRKASVAEKENYA